MACNHNSTGPVILDSGDRTEFDTGAVRDRREGKGRCDMMPLDVVSTYLNDQVIHDISEFQKNGDYVYLYRAINDAKIFVDEYTQFLEVAKHFEEGCKKYGDDNWKKGIPAYCYVDSAVRHYLKYKRGDTDEPHDRAFVWNILCCIWTCIHKPELNTYDRKVEEGPLVRNEDTCVVCGETIPEGGQVCRTCDSIGWVTTKFGAVTRDVWPLFNPNIDPPGTSGTEGIDGVTKWAGSR